MAPLEVRGSGFAARVELEGDAPLVAIDPPPSLPDVSRLPGASIVGVGSAERSGVRVVLGCLRAPSDKWVPGLASVVFERATPMILGAAKMRPALARGAATTVPGARFAEAHHGREGERDATVVHALAFVGDDADAIACSLACSATGSACERVAGSLAIEGDLRPEPPPGLLASGLLAGADHPAAALAIAGTALVAIVALLLATRPKLRPTARARRRR